MSKRDVNLYLDDIVDACSAIEEYLQDMDFETFSFDRKTYSATIREFMVIGEAISQTMELLQSRSPQYDWRMIKDFRNFIVHEYFGVNPRIVYDAATLELEELLKTIISIKKSL